MIIFSIDASVRSTGWAVIQDQTVIETGKIVTKKSEEENIDETIANVTKQLLTLAFDYQADYISLEDGFVGKSSKTALQLAGLRQSIITGFYLKEKRVRSYHPSRVRSLLMGQGNASKEEVANYLAQHFSSPAVVALGPFIDRACKAKNSDQYDAIAVGLATAFDLSSSS